MTRAPSRSSSPRRTEKRTPSTQRYTWSTPDRSRAMNASRSADQVSVSLVIAAADSPAEVPKNSARTGTKSLEDSPCRYQERQDLGHLRRATGIRGEDRAAEPGSLAGGGVDPAVVHPGCGDLDGAGPTHHAPCPGVAVPDHRGPATLVPGVSMPLQVGVHLGLEGRSEHPLRTASADLVQGEGGFGASVVLREALSIGVPPLAGVTTPAAPITDRPEGTPRLSPGPASTTSVHTS
jgi:hypothetical protein